MSKRVGANAFLRQKNFTPLFKKKEAKPSEWLPYTGTYHEMYQMILSLQCGETISVARDNFRLLRTRRRDKCSMKVVQIWRKCAPAVATRRLQCPTLPCAHCTTALLREQEEAIGVTQARPRVAFLIGACCSTGRSSIFLSSRDKEHRSEKTRETDK
jgi:hypothetical protein